MSTIFADDRAAAVATAVDLYLREQGIEPLDGLAKPVCQTGEDYDELIIRADGIARLTQALGGAVAAFGARGARCYWRVRPDIVERLGEGNWLSAYVRFKVTDRPEAAQTEAGSGTDRESPPF